MKCKFTIILITSIISILHAKGYPIAWGYIYHYIDGQLVPVSGAKPLILEGIPPTAPCTLSNQEGLYKCDDCDDAGICEPGYYTICAYKQIGDTIFWGGKVFFWHNIGYERVDIVLNMTYPPYSPCASINQPYDFEGDVLSSPPNLNFNANKENFVNFYPLCNWSDSGFSVFDVKFFSINNRNFIALTGHYTSPQQFRFRIIEYFPETQNLSLKLDLNLPWTTRIFADPPFVYVGMREYGIKVVNFSNPESPETLTISGIRAHDICGDEDYLYVASGTGLAVINKFDFSVAYTWNDSGDRNYTIAYNPATQKVYLSHRYSMVRIFDASNPPDLIVLDSISVSGDYFDVGVWNHDTLFVIRTPLRGFSLFKEDVTNCGSYEHDYGMVFPYAGIARSPFLYVCWEVQGIHKYLFSAGEFQLTGYFQPDTSWYGAVESCDIIDDSTIVIGANDRGVYLLKERTVGTEECIPCKKTTINALYTRGKLKFNIPSQEPLPVRVEIFTIDGKRIYSKAIKQPGLQEIDVKLPSGVYLMVLNGKRRYTAKFVSVD